MPNEEIQMFVDQALVGKVFMDGLVLSAKLLGRSSFSATTKSTYQVVLQLAVTTISIPKGTKLLCRLESVNVENYQNELKSYIFSPVHVEFEDPNTNSKFLQLSKKSSIVITDMELGQMDASILDSMKEGDLINIETVVTYRYIGETTLPVTGKVAKVIPPLLVSGKVPAVTPIKADVWKTTSHLFEPISGKPVLDPGQGKFQLTPLGYLPKDNSDNFYSEEYIKFVHDNWRELCEANHASENVVKIHP
jgi:hypothetical protein